VSAIDHQALPEPPLDLSEHSARLVHKIIAETAASGAISFARYMQMALYEPGLGYYSAGLRKFGPGGDFITAPEVSSLYSRAVANQCRQILAALHEPVMLEFGAGSGCMAADLLTHLAGLRSLPRNYLIMETSADLRQRQQQRLSEVLPDYYPNIIWLDTLPEEPLDAVIVANEVLDALPVHRVTLKDGVIHEQTVSISDGSLAFAVRELSSTLNEYCRLHDVINCDCEDGYTTELHTGYAPWLGSLSALLQRGVILLIDYGYTGAEYYSPERRTGTLLCHYRHRVHDDPFWYPGLQDITSSVNFSTVNTIAQQCSLDLLGYTTQAGFLIGSGLDQLYAEQVCNDDIDRYRLNQEVRTLTMPDAMGERFQVMALGRGMDLPLQGFSFTDLSHRL